MSPPPPPPPPPMPHENVDGQLTIDLVCTNNIKPHMKMRTLNWRRIPKRKVLCQQVTSPNKTFDGHQQTMIGQQSRRQTFCSTMSTSCIDNTESEEDKNVWFLIAKENKSIKEVGSSSSNRSSHTNTKSASKIREMLESVRRRMAAISATSEPLIISEDYKRPKNILEVIDFDDLENLFSLNSQPSDVPESPNFVRRSSMGTNASSDSVISSNSYSNDSSNNGGDDDDTFFELENILDSKKSLNVNIFLKQLKSPDELIDQVNRGDHKEVGKERLESLLKLLPDETEKALLMRFYKRNRQNRLPVAERFLLQLLTEVPNLKLRIKFMLLQEEYRTDLDAISPELDKIDKAAKEIRSSKMLREILNLVLVTGNFLNTGGYAADAAGFSLDCLERLSEVRSNKPGVYLIHYVADIANKLNLTDFQKKELPHIDSASRVCIESIKLDLSSMMDKIIDLKSDTDKEAEKTDTTNKSADNISEKATSDEKATNEKSTEINEKTDKLFLLNLLRTLEDIKNNVEFLKRRTTYNLEETRKELADYLCEDSDAFKLHDCFHYILAFSQRLKTAWEENERRRRIESSKADRSFNCTLRRSNTINHRLLLSDTAQGRRSIGSAKLSPGFTYLRRVNGMSRF